MRRLAAAAAIPVATLCFAACGVSSGCTDIGSTSGVSLVLPQDVYRDGRTVDVRLCQDDECASASADLYQVRADQSVHATVEFPQFASTFEDENAAITVVIREGTEAVRTIESTVTLTRSHPNGRHCDGEDGYLFANADLSPTGTSYAPDPRVPAIPAGVIVQRRGSGSWGPGVVPVSR